MMPTYQHNSSDRTWLMAGIALLLAILVGTALPFYVELMGEPSAKLAVFPALLALGILFLYDRKQMLVLIILLRSAGDIFLESTRFSLGGYQVGVGGLINAFVILIALLLVLEHPKAVPKRSAWIWVPFLLVSLYGVAVSPDKSDAIRSWLGLLSFFAIFISAFHFVKTKEDFVFCVKLVLWSSLFPVLYAFADVALNSASAGAEGFRLRSTFAHPNIFAFYLTLVISLVFYMVKSLTGKQHTGARIVLGLYLFVLLGLLILTKTRSAWIACAIGFVLYGIFFERRYLLYLLGLAVVALFIPGVADRIADLKEGNQVITYAKLNSFAWRVYIWTSALEWTRPVDYLLGHGWQSFRKLSPQFFPMAGTGNPGAHSVYVQVLFELGLAGLLSYLLLYYKVLRDLFAMVKLERLGAFTLIVMVLNYLICAISDNMLDYLSFNWYLWFMVGAGCALVAVRPTRQAAAASGETGDGAKPAVGSR